MNSKKAKQIRRYAALKTQGLPQEKTDIAYKEMKKVYSKANVILKTKNK